MILEIRVPISPRRHFFRQVEALYRSAKASSGPEVRIRLVVSVGEDMEPYEIAKIERWSDENVIWRWVPREEFQKDGYYATGRDRFQIKTDADFVLLADADTIFIRDANDVLSSLSVTPVIAGVIAFLPPFYGSVGMTWPEIYKKLGRQLPSAWYQHSGWGVIYDDYASRFCPAYFNFGVVFVPGSMIEALSTAFLAECKTVANAGVGFFSYQLAFALAISSAGLPHAALDLRYNFPNIPAFDNRFGNELEDVRIIHYLNGDMVKRQTIWSSDDETRRFLITAGLKGSNEILRRRIASFSVDLGLS